MFHGVACTGLHSSHQQKKSGAFWRETTSNYGEQEREWSCLSVRVEFIVFYEIKTAIKRAERVWLRVGEKSDSRGAIKSPATKRTRWNWWKT